MKDSPVELICRLRKMRWRAYFLLRFLMNSAAQNNATSLAHAPKYDGGIGFFMDIEKPTAETGSTAILAAPLCAVEWLGCVGDL
jgi:hypothetical protein